MRELVWALVDGSLTPPQHCDAPLLTALRALGESLDESLRLMGGGTPGELIRLVAFHALLAPAGARGGLLEKGDLCGGAGAGGGSGGGGGKVGSVGGDAGESGDELGEYVACGSFQVRQVRHRGCGDERGGGGGGGWGGEWDREGVFWLPPHRREECEFDVEVG